METTIQADLEKIINQSIKNIICIDDDFVEPYGDFSKYDDKKVIFSKDMYNAISEKCECAVTIVPFCKETNSNMICSKMKQKDLLILDWELAGRSDIKIPIDIIDRALSCNIQYICIYTNSSDLIEVCNVLDFYYSGYSRDELETFAAQCEEQGLFQDVLRDEIIDCFEKRRSNIKILKDKAKELGISVKINDLDENSDQLWKNLYYAWSGKLLPEKKTYLSTYNKKENSNVLEIDGRLVFVYGKSNLESYEQEYRLAPQMIIPQIAEHLKKSSKRLLDGLWLYYFNLFQDALYKRTEFFNNISNDAFYYHANNMNSEEGREEVERFFKDSFKDEMTQRIDVKNISIPDSILNMMIENGKMVKPSNILDDLARLNERITMNKSLSDTKHSIAFGDVFQCVNLEDGICEYWLCITAKCDCRRPEVKISNNYIFIGGRSISHKNSIKNAEKNYYSYVDIGTSENGEVISIQWCSKINSIYITMNEVKRGEVIQGYIRDKKIELKYIGNVKENYAQRMANNAYAEGNRVGISLVTINE